MPRPAVLLWVLAIVTAAALPLFAQPAGLLQELTHGYFSQGSVERVEAKGTEFATALARDRRPVVLTDTGAARWRAMGLWTPQYFCSASDASGVEQVSVPVFKHTKRIFTWFTEQSPMAGLAALGWQPPHTKTRRSLCQFWREAHPSLFTDLGAVTLSDDSNATAHGAPLEQLHAAEHAAGGFGTTTRVATPASYMYLSCPLATFPELAQDVDPFDFLVVPREWRPPSKGEGENENESEDEGEGGESGRFDPSRHDVNLWMGTAGVTAQTHYDCSHNLYVQVHGTKSFILSPPSEHAKLHLFPELHPSRRQSQVDFLAEPDRLRSVFANFDHNITGYQADLSPGDVLYIPPFWFHRVMATSDDSISVNMWSTSKEEDVYNELEYRTPVPFESDWSDAQLRIALRKYILLLARHHLARATANDGRPPDTAASRDELWAAAQFVSSFVARSYAPLFAGGQRDESDVAWCDPTTDKATTTLAKSERKKLATWARSKALEDRLERGARRVVDLLAQLEPEPDDGDTSVRELLLQRYVEMIANYFLSTERVHRFFLCCFA